MKLEPSSIGDVKAEPKAWAAWLKGYGAAKFYEAFLHSAQGARGQCVYCGEAIYLDIAEGGGVADWRTAGGDYGCSHSPLNDAEGTGGHKALRLDALVPPKFRDQP